MFQRGSFPRYATGAAEDRLRSGGPAGDAWGCSESGSYADGRRVDHATGTVRERRRAHSAGGPGLALATGFAEDTNGPLRQYLPKGTGLSPHGPEDLVPLARSSKAAHVRRSAGRLQPSVYVRCPPAKARRCRDDP